MTRACFVALVLILLAGAAFLLRWQTGWVPPGWGVLLFDVVSVLVAIWVLRENPGHAR
jgi:hypothetical protein